MSDRDPFEIASKPVRRLPGTRQAQCDDRRSADALAGGFLVGQRRIVDPERRSRTSLGLVALGTGGQAAS